MKKIYFLAFLFGNFSFAQTVVFDQPTVGTNGIVSNVLSNGNAVYSADDFSVPELTQLTRVVVRGFQNQGNFATLYQGLRLVIYTNAATNMPSGIPDGTLGTIVAELNVTGENANIIVDQTVGEGPVTFDIDLLGAIPTPVIVQPSTTYWLVIAPKVNLLAYTAATRFNWYTGEGATGTNYAGKLVDPANAFGAGATNWTSISTLTNNPAFNSLSFTLEGDTNLSVSDVENSFGVSVFPNPMTDLLTISSTNSTLTDLSYQLFDINGRKIIETKESSINVRNLDSGIYFVTILSAGSKVGTKKVIKK